MDAAYAQVSLGFAELVGQLVRETFEALAGAQTHQAGVAADLRAALALDADAFRAKYVTDAEVVAGQVALFGVALAPKLKPNAAMDAALAELLTPEELKGAYYRGGLSSAGYEALCVYALEQLVDERKASLARELQAVEATRIVVDSGEIKARLELSTLAETTPEPTAKRLAIESVAAPVATLPTMKVVSDATTPTKTLLTDSTRAAPLPGVRMVATPARSTASVDLLSEVVIRFKTA